MSFWWTTRDKSGRRHLWQIDFDPMIIIMVVGMLVAMIFPRLFRDPTRVIVLPFVVIVAGLACLSVSKLSLYRKGVWFSFGPRLMSKGYASLYKVAYVLLGVGVLLLLLLLDVLRRA